MVASSSAVALTSDGGLVAEPRDACTREVADRVVYDELRLIVRTIVRTRPRSRPPPVTAIAARSASNAASPGLRRRAPRTALATGGWSRLGPR
jgi:hypothetical protein